MRKSEAKKGFRPGPRGACEASLFAFSRFVPAGEPDEDPRLIAALSLVEAVIFLKRETPAYTIRAVEHRGVIVMLSGSPYR